MNATKLDSRFQRPLAGRLKERVVSRGVKFESRAQVGGACVTVGRQFAAVGRSLRSLAVRPRGVVEFSGRGLGGGRDARLTEGDNFRDDNPCQARELFDNLEQWEVKKSACKLRDAAV